MVKRVACENGYDTMRIAPLIVLMNNNIIIEKGCQLSSRRIQHLLSRHRKGDWGDVSLHRRLANQINANAGTFVVVSVFRATRKATFHWFSSTKFGRAAAQTTVACRKSPLR
jgi:hypothetical protein